MGLLAHRVQKNRPDAAEIASSIEIIRRAFCQIPGVWRIYIFGSCVDGSYQVNSDIDVAVVFASEAAYRAEKSRVFRSRIDTVLPWEPSVLLRQKFEDMKDVGGLAYEIYHRGQLIYDA